MSGKLRVGVVGASFGGAVHVPAFQAQGRFDVVAIASPNRAAEVAKARNVANAFPSVEAMLEAVELDVVAVASPPFDHLASVGAALAAGKHVLCEKPFALNVADAETMLDASKRAGTVCAIAHEFRYTPARMALRELVENGHLGAVRSIAIEWGNAMLAPGRGRANSWWFERAKGGGITGAIASHMIDQASFVAGRTPLRATGYERTAIPQRTFEGATFVSDVADGTFATIDYGEGLIAVVTVDATRGVEGYRLEVHGEAKTAVAAGEGMLEVTTFVVDDDETTELGLKPQAHANLTAAHANLPAFVTMLDAFADAIDGKPAMLPTFADGLATQRVLAAVGYSV